MDASLIGAPPDRRAAVARGVALALGVWVLGVVMNLEVPGPWPPPASILRPSPDLLAALAVAVLLGRRAPGVAAVAVAVLVLLLRVLRSGDALMITYFGRTVTVYLDVYLVPELGRLLGDTMRPWQLAAVGVAGVALVSALLGGTWALARAVLRALTPPGRRRRVLVALAALAGIEVLARLAVGAPVLVARAQTPRLAEEIDFALQVWGYRGETRDALARAAADLEAAPGDLGRLADTDVVLLFVESYGTTVFDHPAHRRAFAPAFASFREAVREDGWHGRSTRLVSPTFGGASWLAHGTVASALPLTSQLRFDLLVTSDLVPLATRFARRGFETVAVMPGTKRPWPEGAFFGYEEHLYRWHFDYAGRGYDWAPMPDQYVLARVLERLRRPDPGPRLVEVVLVSSHAPWRRIPPYLDDWSSLGDGSIFDRDAVELHDVPWPDLSTAGPAYVASLDYVLRCVGGFLARLPRDRRALVVVLGDHQPSQQVTGPDAPWTVPAHVLSRDPALVARFGALGWSPGLAPPGAGEAPRGLEALPLDLLRAGSATGP